MMAPKLQNVRASTDAGFTGRDYASRAATEWVQCEGSRMISCAPRVKSWRSDRTGGSLGHDREPSYARAGVGMFDLDQSSSVNRGGGFFGRTSPMAGLRPMRAGRFR